MTRRSPQAPPSRFAAGLAFAVVSAMSFGLSGALAKGLLVEGWSPAAAVTARIVGRRARARRRPALVALRGRWHLLRRNARLVVGYGVVAVAGCQFAYFSAVEHLQVGVALLLEYTAPVVVIGWLWLRHGQRPGLLIGVGCVVAGAGLVLVLDVVTGVGLRPGRRAVGAAGDARRRDLLRAVGPAGQRAAADRARRRRDGRGRRRAAAARCGRAAGDGVVHRPRDVRRQPRCRGGWPCSASAW